MKTACKINRPDSGIALITGLIVVFMVAILGISYLSLVSTNLIRADRENKRTTAFYLAEAGVEYKLGNIYNAYPTSGTTDMTSIYETMRPTSTGSVTVTMDTGSIKNGIIVSTATYKGHTESVRVRFTSRRIGIWDNAIFAGVGQSGKGINGNVDIRGSVHILGDGDNFNDLNGNGVRDSAEPFNDLNGNGIYDTGDTFTDTDANGVWSPAEPYQDDNLNGQYDPPLTATDLATTLSGTANIGNNYVGIPSSWLTNGLIFNLPTTNFNGENVASLNAEVRVKHGKVNLSGNARAGNPNVSLNSVKETLDGMYVTDGYGGNAGIANVYSDNGTNYGYDLGEKIQYPSLLDPYSPYATYEDYLVANSMLVPVSTIDGATASFTYGSPSDTNYINWDQTTKVLTMKGIMRFPGDLDICDKKGSIRFSGKGTLFTQSNVRVHGSVLPKVSFPTVDAIGVIAKGDIDLAAGGGESQIQAMGAWYSQKTIRSGYQSNFAGTYVANYFDMGNQVPSIFQVPLLSTNLPPGMPGGDVFFIIAKVASWKHL